MIPVTAMADGALHETTLQARLKRETADSHRRLEAQLGLLDRNLDMHRYRGVLESFYGFYAPLEDDVARVAAMEGPLGFPLRPRTRLLERDLVALGTATTELASLPLCSARPELSCLGDLAGCLYVLEGASLGGSALSPVLHRRLGLTKNSGAAFFVGDEEGTMARWTVVVAWLDGLPRAGVSSERVVHAAKATFDAFARWTALAQRHSI